MTPRIRLTPYKKGGKVDGAWLYQIWLVRGKNVDFVGFAKRIRRVWADRPYGWSVVCSHPARPKLVRAFAPKLRDVRLVVADTLNIYLAEFVEAALYANERREKT